MEDSSENMNERLRGLARGARDRIAGTADVVTGIQSRRQWEAFTDAVTRAVIGVHRDQEELRKAQGELGTQHEALNQEFHAMHSGTNAHTNQRPLWFAILGVGALGVAALVLGVIALWRSF